MEEKELDVGILNNPVTEDPGIAENEILNLTQTGAYRNQKDPFHGKVCDRVQRLYEVKFREADKALKGVPDDDQSFAHELNEMFGSKEDVVKSGEEARQGWENDRVNAMQDKTISELRSKWGRDYENNMKNFVDPIVKGYLSSPEDKAWFNSIGPDGRRIGDDPFLIEKIFELGKYIKGRGYLREGNK